MILAQQGPAEPQPSEPLATLFLVSSAGAVVVALTNVTLLACTLHVACLRDLEILSSLRLLLEGVGINLLAFAPATLGKPFELNAPGSLLVFIALSIAVMLVIFWTVAGLLAPVVVATQRWSRRMVKTLFTTWLWGNAYPLGALVAFTSLAVLPVAFNLLRNAAHFKILSGALTVAVGAATWSGLLWLLRRPEAIRRFIRVTCVSSLAVAAAAWGGALIAIALTPRPAQPAAAPGLPNILLVSIDSLRRDHVHCYAYPRDTSPTIDSLAHEGVMFRTVVSPTSWTLPAHLTLLTALPPEAHGVIDDGMRLSGDALFLAEVLWQAGYTTAGFVSAPYLDAAYGFSQGFDHYDDYTIAKASQARSHQGTTSPALLDTISKWLTAWDGGRRQRPFFLFVHMWDVHYDYTPPPPYDSMFDPDYKGTVTGENYEYGTQVHLGMDPRDLEHIIALYDGEIRFTDLYLGHLLERLRAQGIIDNTIVVVTADHGDEFFEHGNKSHSKALYDETTLVPLVIRFPHKVPQGKVIDGQVRLMDVAPTILSLAGVAQPPEFGASAFTGVYRAQDLSPWISAEPNAEPPTLIAFGDLQTAYAPKPIASVRTGTFKLIRDLRNPLGEEFYDLGVDPGERENILRLDPTISTPLRQELAQWRDGWHGALKRSERVALSEEHKERLRALGYMK